MQRGDERWAVGARVGLWTNEAALPEEVLTQQLLCTSGRDRPFSSDVSSVPLLLAAWWCHRATPDSVA